MPLKELISDIKILCKEHNIKLHLPKTKSVKYADLHISGYFDEKTLACAMGKEDSAQILTHESCHLDQFLEKSKYWVNPKMDLDEWLSGKDFSDATVQKSIDQYRDVELDCEKRAVKKMKEYKIPFNKKEYIQKANSYVQFYNYIKYSRKWCDKNNTPYSNPNVWQVMPTKWMPKKWYKTLPEDLLAVFIQNNI